MGRKWNLFYFIRTLFLPVRCAEGYAANSRRNWRQILEQNSMVPHNVIQIMEQRKSGVVSGPCYKKSVLRSLGASFKVNKEAFCYPVRAPLNGDVDGNKLLMVKNGSIVVTYQVGRRDEGHICRLTGIWRSKSSAGHCADALCVRWCCPAENRFTVSGKTDRLYIVDATNMKEVTSFNMSNNGVTKTHSHAHSPKLAKSVAVGTDLEKLLLLDLRSGDMIVSPGRHGSIRGLSWCPARDYMLVTATDQSLQLWDVRLLTTPLGDFDSCPMSDQILPQIAFWGSTRVLTMVSRNFICVHDLQTMQMLRIMSQLHLDGYHYQEGAFRFAVNSGADLLYCPFDNFVSVVDLNSGNLIWALREHRHSVKSIFFNPHLNLIYSFSFDESYVWSPCS